MDEAVDIVLQAIAGLEAAERVGVLHRDIKPSNCFIDERGQAKIGDFGLSISTLAKDQSQLTLSGSFMGTPVYASPEQLKGEALDVRSDIYSLGVTLYYILTGELPFDADNLIKLVATVLDQPPRAPLSEPCLRYSRTRPLTLPFTRNHNKSTCTGGLGRAANLIQCLADVLPRQLGNKRIALAIEGPQNEFD